jgi:hypothetical protein
MTDEQIWNVIYWLGYALAAAMGFGWWLKSQFTGREIRGLKAENENLKAQSAVANERRLLAEDQQKYTANELATVKAQLVRAQEQLNAREPAEAIAGTIKVIESSTFAAITSNNEIGRVLRADPPKEVKMFSLTKSNE